MNPKRASLILFLFLTACGSKSGKSQNDCPTATLGPTEHAGYLAADETWTAAASPHRITSAFTVSPGVTLTLEPCARVELDAAVSFLVDGTLFARGTATRPISFTQSTPGSRYESLLIRAPGLADLAYVTLEGGGSTVGSSFGATVRVEGDWPPSSTLAVNHVTIRDSAGVGLWMNKWAVFAAGSTALTVTQSGVSEAAFPFPVRTTINTLSSLPDGNYTGNASDVIWVIAESPHYTVEIDDTFRNRGVPYQIGGSGAFGLIEVYSSAGPTLTIEAGVEIQFSSAGSGGLFVGNGTAAADQGRVVAEGTQAEPIVFTGVGTATPGMWEGVTFEGSLANTSVLDHVEVLNAGAHGGDNGFGCPLIGAGGAPDGATDGAIKIFAEPASAFITNTHIADSSSHGIYRAWVGAQIDFLPTNTFTNVPWCDQVEPTPPVGPCPTTPSCP